LRFRKRDVRDAKGGYRCLLPQGCLLLFRLLPLRILFLFPQFSLLLSCALQLLFDAAHITARHVGSFLAQSRGWLAVFRKSYANLPRYFQTQQQRTCCLFALVQSTANVRALPYLPLAPWP
jgi:hypothetical protein